MSYVEEADELRAELAVCREMNRAIHEQDTANVATIGKARAEAREWYQRGLGSASDYDKGGRNCANAIMALLGYVDEPDDAG